MSYDLESFFSEPPALLDHLPTQEPEKLKISSLETPHLFLNPSDYFPGFEAGSGIAAFSYRRGVVHEARIPGIRHKEGVEQWMNIDIKAPNFLYRAVARAKKQDPSYTATINPRF